MKTEILKSELTGIINANPYHTFDYTQGFGTETAEVLQIQDKDCYGYLLIYKSQEELTNDVLSNLKGLDLTDGADDQYYDYNPSCVEAIIYALPLLPFKTQEEVIETLKNKLQSFIEDEEQDEDMWDQYENYLEAIKEYSINHDTYHLDQVLEFSHSLINA